MKRVWSITLDRNCAYVRGYGTREQIIELKGRPPTWSRAEKAWVCQPSTAHDVIASAERRGIVVNVRGGPGDLAPDGARSQVSPVRNLTPASTSPQEGLW